MHRTWSFYIVVVQGTTKKCTKNYNARAQPLFSSLNLLFGRILVAIAVVVCLQVLANEDTLLRTHCCRHKCFPVCPRAQHLLRTQKMFLILFRNILCPQQMFPSLCSPRNIMGNNVSPFTRALTLQHCCCPWELQYVCCFVLMSFQTTIALVRSLINSPQSSKDVLLSSFNNGESMFTILLYYLCCPNREHKQTTKATATRKSANKRF